MIYRTILLLVAVTLAAAQTAYVTNIEVDTITQQVYVLDSAGHLYEFDSGDLTQNMAHNFPDGATVGQNTLFITTVARRRRLYAEFNNAAGGINTEYFKAPLGKQKTLPVAASNTIASNPLFVDPVTTYDRVLNVGIVPNVGGGDKNITLLDLTTATALATRSAIFNIREYGYNLVINHNNNHLIAFYTYRPVSSMYGLSCVEFSLAGGKITPVRTTYVGAGSNPTASPFYQVTLVTQDCAIDYTNNKLWCVKDGYNPSGEPAAAFRGLFRFKAADDLSSADVIPISVAYDFIQFDFSNQVGYAISAAASGKGFQVYKLNINTGSVISTYTNADLVIDPFTTKLDTSAPQLYIPVETTDNSIKVVAVNTNTLTAKVIPLTTAGYL